MTQNASRAAQNALGGNMRPAGRVFETLVYMDVKLNERWNICSM